MANSYLRYHLSRPYPFQWFTPVALISLAIFATIFSLLNFAANGYVLAVHYTDNPNATLTSEKFLTQWPLNFMGKVSGSCEARDILVGTKFFTNKLSLPYRLDSVVRSEAASNGHADGVVPSLSYLKNTLEDCSVYNMQIELLAEDRTAAQFGYVQWGPKISASASCFVLTSSGRMMLNLSTEYDLIPPTIENGQQTTFLQRDAKNRASLWWGESLLSMYWITLADAMQQQRGTGSIENGALIRKGSINLSPRLDVDFSTMNFFDVRYHFIEQTDGSNVRIYVNEQDDTLQKITDGYDTRSVKLNIWNDVDRYGKSFYSTVLADLGQQNSPNILSPSSKDVLGEYTASLDNFPIGSNAVLGPATSSYNGMSIQANAGSLEITPSTIHSQYLCQIPERKPWPHLIVAIILADLVFLRVVWTLMNLLATWWVVKHDQHAMFCPGEFHRYRGPVDEEAEIIQFQSAGVETKGMNGVEVRGDNEGYTPVQGGHGRSAILS